MAATLYGAITSPHIQRVLLVSKYLGVPLTFQFVNLRKGEQKEEAFLQINPFGQVPAYVSADGSLKLFESRAIARYIDRAAGGKLLHTNDPSLYALVEQWAAVEVGTFSKDAFVIFYELLVKPNYRKEPTNQAAVDAAIPDFKKTLAVYEKHLATSKFLVGNEISIADLFHVPVLATVATRILPDLLDAYPNVKRWLGELTALPAWHEIMKELQTFMDAWQKMLQQQQQQQQPNA